MVNALRRLLVFSGLAAMFTRKPTNMFQTMQEQVDNARPEIRCENCHWWRRLDRATADSMGVSPNIDPGNCHFNPPSTLGFGRAKANQFCSHFKKEGAS